MNSQMILDLLFLFHVQAAKAVSQALNQVVNCLPGQRDVDQAIKAIAEASQALQKKQVDSPHLVSP